MGGEGGAYGDPAHVHATTAAGATYTASYDAAGDMACRAPTSASTCGGGTPNGAQLGYNNEGELAAWQSAPASPTATTAFLYDGQGERVIQQATTGASTTTTTYYYVGGKRVALGVGGTISYLASDALGSSSVTLNGTGTATASQLFAPYGSVRYSSGTLPTSFGFTGQRNDAATGLDYLHARHLDPVLGQFASADKLLQGGGFDILGLSRYAYVAGNPINRTDPSGQYADSGNSCDPNCGGYDQVQASVGHYGVAWGDPVYSPPGFPYGPADPCGGWCTPAPYHSPAPAYVPAPQSAQAPAPSESPAPVPSPGRGCGLGNLGACGNGLLYGVSRLDEREARCCRLRRRASAGGLLTAPLDEADLAGVAAVGERDHAERDAAGRHRQPGLSATTSRAD